MVTYFLTDQDLARTPTPSLFHLDHPVLTMRDYGDRLELTLLDGKTYYFNLREQGYQVRKI